MNAARLSLAQASIDHFLTSPDWLEERERWGWTVTRLDALTLIARLRARPVEAQDDQFTLRLACEFCPELPPNVRFVNPVTLGYDPATDAAHVARLEAPDCRTHLSYPFQEAYLYGPQLVCTSMSHGYYVSGHVPTPDQRWDGRRHGIGSAITVVQRTLIHPTAYQGRFA